MPRLPGGPCHHRFRRHNGPLRALKTLISRIFVQSMPFQCPTWPPDWPSIELAIQEAIRTGQWGQYHSPLIKSLQKRLAEYLKSGPIRLCCSGTAALELALRCCRIRETDEVILAAYDFPGNFRTVELLGARPVLVDATSNFIAGRHAISPSPDAEQVAAAASPSVRAVIASHLHGGQADMHALRQICDDHGWFLIEDACQAIGGQIDGEPIGSFGHLATLSFGGSKLISAGSGGAIIANDERLAARLGGLLDRPGDTFPIGPLQCAAIQPQLQRLDDLNRARNLTAEFLRKNVFQELADWEVLTTSANSRPQTPDDPSTSTGSTIAAHYKFGWLTPSNERRQHVIEHGRAMGLPLGEGFRSMSSASAKRCRKIGSMPHAETLGERLVVMDHRALMTPPEHHDELRDSIHELYRYVNAIGG